MAKINIRKTNPAHYAKVKAEQDKLKDICGSQIKVARLCPYCGHTVSFICKGSHAYAQEKCPNCGENVTFPPIMFRRAT